MEKFIVNKLKQFSKKNQVPFIYFLDKNGEILFKKHQNDFFENYNEFEVWEQKFTHKCIISFHLHLEETAIFLDSFNLLIACQNIYDNEQKIGVLALGGFRLQHFDYREIKLSYEHWELFDKLPVILSKKELIERTSRFFSSTKNVQLESNFQKIIELLSNEMHIKHTLNSISNIFHLSPSTIKRLFQLHTGYSFTTFYTEMKIKKALQMRTEGLAYHKILEYLGYKESKCFLEKLKKRLRDDVEDSI
ncbi:hypothetical protein SAMN02745116_01812 [Pilibacter termitis]|uniref:HTH araC/xylS-type domain-containing protein n=1 Tax=Pilibacter termitis TaxID=263852 RepID=A0A1T4PIV8_9ENTE|nr:helix-turn-helix domain-containing protein [Pilibacter termitis]SJZ91429.1 hypothetical protein SAMN02745116_01812 [Pilibacter termitis]